MLHIPFTVDMGIEVVTGTVGVAEYAGFGLDPNIPFVHQGSKQVWNLAQMR